MIPGLAPASARRAGLLGLALCSAWGELQAQQYPQAPEVLRDAAARGAADIVAAADSGASGSEAAELLDQVWDRLVFYTVADALPGDDLHQVRGLRAYRYLSEVTRTDKQLGATSSGPGSTTLAEKPGIPDLVAFAVDHGAVEQTISGTGLTLTSSPYAFIRLLRPDNATNFDQYGLWRRLGVSATFNLQTEDSTQGDFKQLAEWSVRLRVLGDRSTRSRGFTRRWSEVVQPRIQRRLNALSGGISAALNGSPALRDAADSQAAGLRDRIARYLDDSRGAAPERRTGEVTGLILSGLKQSVYDPVADGTIPLTEKTSRSITSAVSALSRAHDELFQAQEDLGGILDELGKSTLLTAAFTHHTGMPDGGYSEMKLLFEAHVAPFDAIVNGFVSLYDDPDKALDQTRVRDFGGTVELEGQVRNPFGRSRRLEPVEPITLAAGYQLSRLKEADQTVHIAQARINIPIATGVSLPISVTYASRGDLVDEDHLRGNFGFSLDLDKLYAIGAAFGGN